MQIQPNSIEFQMLELPRILERSDKESCSIFNSLQIHILFENFLHGKTFFEAFEI
jgi:hypothetical protein